MPARVVIVHNELGLLEQLTTSLRQSGYEVAAFSDPMEALDALDKAQTVELLITRGSRVPEQSTALKARMARFRRRNIQILFTALPEFEQEVKGLGEFMPMPVAVPDVADAAGRLLNSAAGAHANAQVA